jgi:hypothetical protein
VLQGQAQKDMIRSSRSSNDDRRIVPKESSVTGDQQRADAKSQDAMSPAQHLKVQHLHRESYYPVCVHALGL